MSLKDIITAFRRGPHGPEPKLRDKADEEPSGPTGLVERIHGFVTKGGYHEPRAPGFHCSEMYNFCARRSVLDKMGRSKVDSFARLYVLPQTGHGLTGNNYTTDGDGKQIESKPIPNTFDRFAILTDWV